MTVQGVRKQDKSHLKFDVFVSHNTAQKCWARKFVKVVRDIGLSVFFDEDSIDPGENVVVGIERGLRNSRHIVLLISPESAASRWVAMEIATTINTDPSGSERRLIPVLLEPTKTDDLMLSVTNLNMVDLTEGVRRDIEYLRLLVAVGVSTKDTPSELLVFPDDTEDRLLATCLPEESTYVKMRIRDLMISDLLSNGIDIEKLWHRHDITFTSLVKRCKLHYPDADPDIVRCLTRARSFAYDRKYSTRKVAQDERHIDFDEWQGEFRSLIRVAGFANLRHVRAINVGIGNGTECPDFYSDFERFIGVDISLDALTRAQDHFPQMQTSHTDGEHLVDVESCSQDLYISLRTYQSTLFDIEKALFETYRVLRSGGVAIISVSNAHRINENVVPGILRSSGREVDLDLPYDIANRIRASLTRLDFTNIGIRTGTYEVYAYGKKTR